jgi:hypothetical protein
MPVVVAVHRLKNFDEWFKLFKADPPPKVGRWRVLRGADDRNRAHVVGEMAMNEPASREGAAGWSSRE